MTDGEAGASAGAARETVGRAVRECLKVKRESVRASTARRYEELARRYLLPAFGELPLSALSGAKIRKEVSGWLSGEALEFPLSRSTVRQAVVLLRNSLDLAVEDGLLSANPVSGVSRQFRLCSRKKAAGEPSEVYYVPAREVEEILAQFKRERPRLQPLFLTLHRAGLRLGEARALKWDDLDFSPRTRSIHVQRTFSKGGRLEPPKGGTPRVVDMSQQLAQVLFALRENAPAKTPWVFSTRTGTPFGERNLERDWKLTLRSANLPERYRIHDLRHSFAIEVLRQGKNLVYVRDQLGHSDIQVTANFYGRYTRLRDLSAVDALDALARQGEYAFRR